MKSAVIPRNVGRIPNVVVTTPPTNGPVITPMVAATWAYPTASPRRSTGARAATHASPAPHTAASAAPWSRRATMSSGNELASARPAVAPASRRVPTAVTSRAPTRSARWPMGTATTMTARLNEASIQAVWSVLRPSSCR